MRRILCSVSVLAALTAATGAHASVESVSTPRRPESNCTKAQENDTAALWRPANGRLVIGGEGTGTLEVYGHGIDLSPDAQLTGISGGSARRIEGRGGAVNSAHGCGNIGSIVVEISLPAVRSANNGTLRIGSETIPFTATPRAALNARWDDANEANGRAAPPPTTSTAPPPPSPPTIVNSGNNCSGPGCPAPGPSVKMTGPGGSTVNQPDTRTLSRCADDDGLKGEVSNFGRDLTLILPLNRTGAIEECYRRHLLVTFQTRGINDAMTLNGPSPTLGMTAPATLRASFRQQENLRERAGLVTIDDDVLKTFVGRRSFDIDLTPGDSTSRLKLTLKSEPAYGPKAIAAPVTLPNVGRLSSDIGLKVTAHQAAGADETYAWRLTPMDGAPGNCFAQTSGTATAPTGATTFDLPLRATEAANCTGKSFRATVATASVANPAGTPFEQSVTFVLQPLSTVNLPPQNRAAPQGLRPTL